MSNANPSQKGKIKFSDAMAESNDRHKFYEGDMQYHGVEILKPLNDYIAQESNRDEPGHLVYSGDGTRAIFGKRRSGR